MIIHLRSAGSLFTVCKEQLRLSIHWTSPECAKDPTPASFAFPYSWEGVAICVECVRRAKR